MVRADHDALSLAGSGVAFLPFHHWRRRRRARQLELGRSGKLATGQAHVWKPTYRTNVLAVRIEGVTARTMFPPRGVHSGDHIQVLFRGGECLGARLQAER